MKESPHKPVKIEDLWEIEDVWPKREGEIMLNTQDKRDVIYALEEWTKVLEQEGNITKRNEIMELTWKVSSSLGGDQ